MLVIISLVIKAVFVQNNNLFISSSLVLYFTVNNKNKVLKSVLKNYSSLKVRLYIYDFYHE